MKARVRKLTISNKRLIVIAFVTILAAFSILFLFQFIDKIPTDFVSDQFGPFSDKVYPIEVEESVIGKNQFKLSQRNPISDTKNHLIDDNADYVYEISYGSYPIITTELGATRLTTAYAMSILDMTYEKACLFTSEDKTVVPYLFMYPANRNINLGLSAENDGKICQTILDVNENADVSIVSSDGLISLQYYAEESNIDLVYNNFANDAIVVFTSADNPVESISKDELKAIYNGDIKNWKRVGGPNKKIKRYERSVFSPAQKAFEIYALDIYQQQKEWTEILDVKLHESDRQEYINSPYSIGYCLKSQFDLSYAKDDNIKILKINGVLPTEEKISNGTYPLSVLYYYVYKSDDKLDVAGKFADWMMSNEGINCIYSAGLIPVK